MSGFNFSPEDYAKVREGLRQIGRAGFHTRRALRQAEAIGVTAALVAHCRPAGIGISDPLNAVFEGYDEEEKKAAGIGG